MKKSLTKESTRTSISKRVRFSDQAYMLAKESDESLTVEYFIYVIEKYFGQEGEIVCLETDGEQVQYVEKVEDEAYEFNKKLAELDDFFLESSDEEI